MSLPIQHLYPTLTVADTVGGTTVGTTETQFLAELPVVKGSVQVGDYWDCTAWVDCPATNSSDTLTLKAYIGPTTAIKTGLLICDMTAIDVANNASIMLRFQIACVAAGVGSTATFAGGGTSFADAVTGVSKTRAVAIGTDAQLSTVANMAIGICATWSVSSAGNSARLRCFHGIKYSARPSL